MAFTLPPLPYPPDALEPSIDKMTMEIHHGKHHKAYVDNLNAALAGHADLQGKSIEQLLRDINAVPQNIRQAVINNGGGHANHSMFWEIMGPGGGGQPGGPLAQALNLNFGSFDNFKAKIKEAEEVTEPGQTVSVTYHVEVLAADGRTLEVIFDPMGTVLKEDVRKEKK